MAAEQGDDRFGECQERRLWEHTEQVEEAVVLENRSQTMSSRQAQMSDRVGTGSELALDAVLQMAHARVGRHENPGAGDLRPPADVDLRTGAAHGGVVAV